MTAVVAAVAGQQLGAGFSRRASQPACRAAERASAGTAAGGGGACSLCRHVSDGHAILFQGDGEGERSQHEVHLPHIKRQLPPLHGVGAVECEGRHRAQEDACAAQGIAGMVCARGRACLALGTSLLPGAQQRALRRCWPGPIYPTHRSAWSPLLPASQPASRTVLKVSVGAVEFLAAVDGEEVAALIGLLLGCRIHILAGCRGHTGRRQPISRLLAAVGCLSTPPGSALPAACRALLPLPCSTVQHTAAAQPLACSPDESPPRARLADDPFPRVWLRGGQAREGQAVPV